MAQRRMFSKALVQSARFLRMSGQARLLYFELGMAADDDGVAEAFAVLKLTGASENVLHELESRVFLTVLNEDLVVYITDWKQNNLIRKNRYQEGMYAPLLRQVLGDAAPLPPREPEGEETQPEPQAGSPANSRGESVDSQVAANCQPSGSHAAANCQPCGSQWAAQDRLGQDRSGQDRSGQDRSEQDSPPLSPRGEGGAEAAFARFWEAYPRKTGKREAQRAFRKVTVPLETLLGAVQRQKTWEQWRRDQGRFIPHPATWLNQGRWEDEMPPGALGNAVRRDADYERGEDFLS